MTSLSLIHRDKVHPLPLKRMTSDAAVFVRKASILAGKFKGSGTANLHGEKIEYDESLCFTIIRKNPRMVVYRIQTATTRQNDKPLHLEMGVVKILSSDGDTGDKDSLVLHANAGLTHPLTKNAHHEQATGTLDTSTGTLVLESAGFQKVKSDEKHVTALRRVYRRQGNRLTYDQYLGFDGSDELTHHLHCELLEIQD